MTVAQRIIGDYVLAEGVLVANGAIDVDGTGRIVAVGANLSPTDAPVHSVGGLLMPGMVNAHAHTPMTLVRSAGDGLPLQQWLVEGVWPREAQMSTDDARAGMLLGSAEMLLAGVTTSCEMYLFEDAIVDAVKQSGARVVVTPGIIVALAPGGNIEGRLDEVDAFHSEHHDPDGRVTVGFGPHSLYDLSPEQVAEIGARASARDALVHIHLEETQFERQEVIDKWTGQTATELLADAGLLEGKLLGAHGVWLSESDQWLLANAGAGVAHCPQSNLKLGSGVAPIVDMLAKGVHVGLGTDGPASNDDLDLWEEMKLAPLLARGTRHDAAAMTAAKALELATRGGATAIGLGGAHGVGDLTPGKWADIIRIDLDNPSFTPGVEQDMLSNIVFGGSSRFVTDVWVAGEMVVGDRSLLTIDVDQAMADARIRGRRLASNL